MKAHLVDCTYCEHRLVTSATKRRGGGEIERCDLTMLNLPRPFEPGRFCEHFHQEGHDCDHCFVNDIFQMVNTIDN